MTRLSMGVGVGVGILCQYNGLSEKYGSLAQRIAHKDPFPDLATVRTMVTTEEMRLRSKQSIFSTSTTSSSPQVLPCYKSNPRIQTTRNNRIAMPLMKKKNQDRDLPQLWPRRQQKLFGPVWLSISKVSANQFQHNNTISGIRPNAPPDFNKLKDQHHPTFWFNVPPAGPPTQAAVSKPSCLLDTGAGSSPLNSSVNNLSTIFNSRIYPSVLVGDEKSILVTNTGHSTLPTPYRTLHLNNRLMGGIVDPSNLLRFDKQRVTLSSHSPSYLKLSGDSKTWHQRLSHPGSEVLRSLVSNNLISCNKTQSSVLCHACQLGKHVRLPFSLLETIVKAPFDIIHSDLWTSPLTCYRINIIRTKAASLMQMVATHLAVLDVDETFIPVVKQATIRTVLSLAISKHWPVHQLDVKNAFLHGSLSETCIFVTRNASGMFLSQQKYATEVLDRAGMLNCKPCRTPVDTDSKLSADGAPISDSTLYRSLAGALQYLTFTRPDISYVVQQVCLFMHDPREPHLSALKRILRYVRGTLSYGLQLYSSTTSSLVAYSDADWAGCPTTRRSTSGYCVFLGNNLLSWSSKRQFTLSRSSTEAEYRGLPIGFAETCWLRNLLRELHTPLATATLVYCDNVSAVYLSSNPVQHQRTKHIEIDIHFVRDLVATGAIRVLHVPSRYQYADIFTKGLPTSLFDEFRTSLSVRSSPAPTAGGFACRDLEAAFEYPDAGANDAGLLEDGNFDCYDGYEDRVYDLPKAQQAFCDQFDICLCSRVMK
ncbi:ribonuclease H-like domain-containing protein [Tanacetum coccineum]